MRILIAGGTGLVGKELGKKLVEKGHELFVLTRNKSAAEKTCPFPMTAVSWDELNSSEAIHNLDSIVNLAGANLADRRWSSNFKKQIYDSRINTTQKLIQLANRRCQNLKSFVSTSAIGIYGECDDKMITEDYPKSYSFLGKLCQDWEAPIEQLENGRGVILRVGIVFSEKGGALDKMVPPIQAGIGGPLAGGKNYMSWIDIEDLVNMYIYAIENDINGVFNATSPSPETNKTATQRIAEHLAVKAPFSVPFLALRIVVGEMAHHIIESQKVIPDKIQKLGFKFKYPTIESSIAVRVPKLKGMEKRFIFEQWIPATKEEIFPFFAEARNLEQLTPPSLNFRIDSVSTSEVQDGTEIFYRLKIDGVPVRWKTLITRWNPPHEFADNQEKGPYSKWFHIHRFEDLAGGTLMTDQVDFKIPLGALGYIATSWKVLRDVKNIFNYRMETIKKLYP